MNLRELTYLVAVADHGHFGRAAAACHVSQPTLSVQLKKLEGYLGVVLIERSPKGVRLTPIGESVVAHARQALAEIDALVALTRRRPGPLVGPLQLGVIPTLGPYLLPHILPPLRAAYPALRLVVQEDLTAVLLERLEAQRLDAAVLALPIDVRGLATAPLFDDPFWFVCRSSHALARAPAIGDDDLASERILLLTEGHCLRDQALALCDARAPGDDDFRATSLETVCQMVAAGLGSSLLPGTAAAGRGTTLAVRPLARPAHRRIALVWRARHPRRNDFEPLAALLRAHLPPGAQAIRNARAR